MAAITICGGRVLDPFQGIDEVREVFCEGGSMTETAGKDPVIVNAEGCYVFPGLIDYHTHLFHGGDFFGVNADLLMAGGVTTALDAGSVGSLNFEQFRKSIIEPSDIRIKALLNICSFGNPGGGYHEDLDPAKFRKQDLKALFDRYYPDLLLGLKIRISRDVTGRYGMDCFRRTVGIAEELGVPLTVHIPDPCGDIGEVVGMLRAGDTVSHVYHGKGQTILDDEGYVRKEVLKARERGVLFDVASACSNSNHIIAEKAIEQGFLPDIISTDMTLLGFAKPHMVKSLPFVMSKFMSLGLSLETAVRCVTQNPAAAMGLAGRIGTLRPGACADITICELREKEVRFTDKFGNSHIGGQILVPVIKYCTVS